MESINQKTAERRGGSVMGAFGYAGNIVGRGRLDTVDPSRRNIVLETKIMPVHDARPRQASLTLDGNGFILVDLPTKHDVKDDLELLRREYVSEQLDFIQEITGASWVIPNRTGLLVRNATLPQVGKTRIGNSVHLDFTPHSAAQLADQARRAEGLEPRPYSRFAVIQTWRALSPPPQDFPLGICDGDSVSEDDQIVVDSIVGPEEIEGNVFETRLVKYNADHRWNYFPDLEANELLVFKGFDSDPALNAACPPHTGFDNREAFPSAHPRASIESRFIAFFD